METIVNEILNAPVIESVADAPTGNDIPEWLRGIAEDVNAGPTTPDSLVTREYQQFKNGALDHTYTVAFTTGHTTKDAPAYLYSEHAGKTVVSVKEDWTDNVLRDLSLVRGGTRAYLALPWKRDKAGFKKVDAALATRIRKAVERLAMTDKAAHHRFDYARFSVMPASDNAPSEIAGYVRIVFTGTRVK